LETTFPLSASKYFWSRKNGPNKKTFKPVVLYTLLGEDYETFLEHVRPEGLLYVPEMWKEEILLVV